jgi:hypothetical protein
MNAIVKPAADRMYALLRLRNGDPNGYAKQIAFGSAVSAVE